jgi:hypothetical protein
MTETMNTGYTLNRVNFTKDEETCILKFLQHAADCGYPSANEPWYPVINSIFRKYYNSNIKEAQPWQTI